MTRARPATERLSTLTRDQVERSLATASSLDAGAFYRAVGMTNPSRTYFVRHRDGLHSLKAIVAHALQCTRSDTLARDFHAADAARRLADLGFDIVHEPASRS